MRWECRYSSCEMLYLEVDPHNVRTYLDHSPNKPELWTFDEVLAGEHDAEVRNLFGDQTVEELKKEVQLRVR